MTDPLIPAQALEGLMKKVFIEGTVSPGLFWDAILKTDLFLPLASQPKKDAESDDYPVLLGVDEDGKEVIWLFTSPKTMIDYLEQEVKYLGMEAPELFKRLKTNSHPLVLIGPLAITLDLHPDLVETLSEGKVPDIKDEQVNFIPHDARVYVGEVKEDTKVMEEKFSKLFESIPEVMEAKFIQIADDSGSRLLLGLKLDEESRDKLKGIVQRLAKTSEGILEKGKSFDVALINGSMKEAFEKWGKTIYTKAK